MRGATQSTVARLLAGVAAVVLGAGMALAAEPEMEPGNWKLHVASTTNGKPEPVQDTQECLGDELKDLGAYFAPELEGVQAKCKKTRLPSADPKKLIYKTQCTGAGFRSDISATVTIESRRRFTAIMQMNTKTKTESALVVANIDARWAGPCKK